MSKKIFIDPGHGGQSGSRSGKYIEDDMINVTVKELEKVLKASGFEVKLSRTYDCTNANKPSLEKRGKMATNWGADFFISVHYNCFNGQAKGFEAWRSVRESKVAGTIGKYMAEMIPSHHGDPVKTKMGTGNKDYYGVLRSSSCPALIVEGGFLDNPEDQKRIGTVEGQIEIARIYAKAICKYYEVPCIIDGSSVTTTESKPTKKEKEEHEYTIGKVNEELVTTSLNVRTTPEIIPNNIIGKLKPGEQVSLLYLHKDWWAVRANCEVGYIKKEFIKYIS